MSLVSFEKVGDVALLTMDDGKANALSPTMIAELDAAFERAEAEAKAVVLTGREGKLCAGFDLKILMGGGDAAKDMFLAGSDLLMRIFLSPQPVVIAATGHAIAGGVLLLGVGDLRIGADGPFKIGLNEVAIGVPLPVFAHEIARRRLDPRHLDRATLMATLYDPKGALEAGWLDEVVEPDALRDRALEEASRLSALNQKAFAISKRSMREDFVDRIKPQAEENLAAILSRMS